MSIDPSPPAVDVVATPEGRRRADQRPRLRWLLTARVIVGALHLVTLTALTIWLGTIGVIAFGLVGFATGLVAAELQRRRLRQRVQSWLDSAGMPPPSLQKPMEELCRETGQPIPDVVVVSTLASRRFQASAAARGRRGVIVITQGAVDALAPAELRGVIAHELAHILRRHRRLIGVVIVAWSLAVALAVPETEAVALFGPRMDVHLAVFSWPLLAGILVFAPWVRLLLPRALSRHEEYRADRCACTLGADPSALAIALWELERNEYPPARRRRQRFEKHHVERELLAPPRRRARLDADHRHRIVVALCGHEAAPLRVLIALLHTTSTHPRGRDRFRRLLDVLDHADSYPTLAVNDWSWRPAMRSELPSTLDLHLGAAVYSSDDKHVGSLHRVVVDRDSWDIHEVIVQETARFSGRLLAPGTGLITDDIIVAKASISRVTHDRVDLSLTSTEVRHLPPYLSYQYEPVSATQSRLDTVAAAVGATMVRPLIESAAKAADEIEVRPGESVMLGHAVHKLGTVRDVLVDDGEFVGIVIHPCGFFAHDVVVQVRFLGRSDDAALFVHMTPQDIERMPRFDPTSE